MDELGEEKGFILSFLMGSAGLLFEMIISTNSLQRKRGNEHERIHPVQFELVGGRVSSGLQAVAVHLVLGYEHGDGTTLQVHFHITFLWEQQERASVR